MMTKEQIMMKITCINFMEDFISKITDNYIHANLHNTIEEYSKEKEELLKKLETL